MRRKALDLAFASGNPRCWRSCHGRRSIQISAAPSSNQQRQNIDSLNGAPDVASGMDVSATDTRKPLVIHRRGTDRDSRCAIRGPRQSVLIPLRVNLGIADAAGTMTDSGCQAVSTLSVLEPFRRAITGIPFLYQRVTSTTPFTALISTKSPITSLVVVHLDGRLDWMIAQQKALLAWTEKSLAHWGNTFVTGRGLLALSGKGLIHQVTLKTGEEYVVHPSNVVAYSITPNAPQPYRFKANLLRFQIPNASAWLPDTRFWRTMRESSAWKFVRDTAFLIRTWGRRAIWGDRLFLHFRGPTQILLQSRSSRLTDALTTRDVNEIADSPAGAVPSALAVRPPSSEQRLPSNAQSATISFASVNQHLILQFPCQRMDAVPRYPPPFDVPQLRIEELCTRAQGGIEHDQASATLQRYVLDFLHELSRDALLPVFPSNEELVDLRPKGPGLRLRHIQRRDSCDFLQRMLTAWRGRGQLEDDDTCADLHLGADGGPIFDQLLQVHRVSFRIWQECSEGAIGENALGVNLRHLHQEMTVLGWVVDEGPREAQALPPCLSLSSVVRSWPVSRPSDRWHRSALVPLGRCTATVSRHVPRFGTWQPEPYPGLTSMLDFHPRFRSGSVTPALPGFATQHFVSSDRAHPSYIPWLPFLAFSSFPPSLWYAFVVHQIPRIVSAVMQPNPPRLLLLAAYLSGFVAATPAPTGHAAKPNLVQPHEPVVTPSRVEWDPTRTWQSRRDILSDLAGDVGSVLSDLGSDIPSFVASGVPNFFQGFPTGSDVQSSLSLDDDQIAALPTNALNIGPYANWTDQGWNVRFHGNIYKQPNVSEDTLNTLANDLFIYGTSLSDLPESQQAQARNLTAEIFVLQQGDVNVSSIQLTPATSQGGSGLPGGGGGSTNTNGGSQSVTLPYPTTPEGDFDVFIPIENQGLTNGNATSEIQRLNTFVTNTTLGNSTAYLVPPTGFTVISDIDDILRVTKIYEPEEGLLNSFARPFTAWEDMTSIYANWSQALPDLHFHYLTTTPEQVTRNYMEFIFDNYPGGSFDTRPLNFSDVSATLSVRKFLLEKIFETFPQRKFILVADTSNSDVMKDYPEMATEFPGQVQCIFLRNTTATDSGDRFPYDTSGFQGLNQSNYMFFVNADDLTNIDITTTCYNTSVAQNLTFGYQGLPLGAGDTAAVNGSANGSEGAAMHLDSQIGLTFFAFVGAVFWGLL
nr:altered inheritance of mitochondria protein 24, mitochondrial [Quercus suber]